MSEGPTDYNDLHLEKGLQEVKRQLEAQVHAFQTRSVTQGAEQFSGDTPPAETYQEQDAPGDWMSDLDLTDKGKIANHVGNLVRVFKHHPAWHGVLAYCDFSYKIVFRARPPIAVTDQAELQDADLARMRVWFNRNIKRMVPPSDKELRDAVVIEAQRHRFHPVQEYLRSLRHDGVPRLRAWLVNVFDSSERREYLELAGVKFLVGAVARVMDPGCKMDNMLILEGEQGRGKSTAINVLFGDWFSDAPIPLGDKDAYQLIQGVWGYEMAELDSFNKSESTTSKSFMSQRTDRFRPPYGAGVQTFKRQTVFVGSTNQDEYLKDYSGNRRYWPLHCRTVDLEWLRLNRDQLWAEAYALYRSGVPWHLVSDEERTLFEDVQDSRLQRDAWEDLIRDWLDDNPLSLEFTAAEILQAALQIPAGSIQRAHQNRIAPIMKQLGYKKARGARRPNPDTPGREYRPHVYVRPDVPAKNGEEGGAPW